MNIQKSLSRTLAFSILFSTIASPGLAADAPKPTAAQPSSVAKPTAVPSAKLREVLSATSTGSSANSNSNSANSSAGSTAKSIAVSDTESVKAWIKSTRYKRTTIRKGRTVTVEYPQFIGEPAESITTLNKLMKKFVNGNMPALEINTDPNSCDYAFDCSYQVSSVTPDLISVEMHFYSFTGGAHGNTITVPFNYKLTENGPKQITLANVFGKKPDLKTLQSLVRLRLVEELYPDDDGADREWINTGTEDLSCFNCISVDKEGLTFNFQQYQVACYAAGMPSISVSYDDLKELFTPASPIYPIVKAAINERTKQSKVAVATLK